MKPAIRIAASMWAKSTIRFDDVDPAATTAATAKAAARQLPPKTRLQIALAKPLDTEAAAAGEEVTAVGTFGRETDTRSRTHPEACGVHGTAPHWVIAIRFESDRSRRRNTTSHAETSRH